MRALVRHIGPAAAWALVLLLGFEAALHCDAWLYRYRSVFAAGRAEDKMRHAANRQPATLFIGNSRTDNGLSPIAFRAGAGLPDDAAVFNLGLPGANTLVLRGVVERLLERGMKPPADVFIALDETLFQDEDSLGYYGFFARRTDLWDDRLHAALFGSWLRSWYYSGNLRQLREPDKLGRFVQATFSEVEPVGGSAAHTAGYRKGRSGGFQSAEQLRAQEGATHAPPDPRMTRHLLDLVERLAGAGSRVHLIAVPMFERASAFGPDVAAGPYADIVPALQARGARWLETPLSRALEAGDFADPGHLNDHGARVFSSSLGQAYARTRTARP